MGSTRRLDVAQMSIFQNVTCLGCDAVLAFAGAHVDQTMFTGEWCAGRYVLYSTPNPQEMWSKISRCLASWSDNF
jgi:hypothetical protein